MKLTSPEREHVSEVNPQERLGTLLKALRAVHRVSTRGLGQRAGVSHSYIAMLEGGGIDPRSGKRINPSPARLKLLGDQLSGSYLALMATMNYLPNTVSLTEQDLFQKPELTKIREKVEAKLGQDIFKFLTTGWFPEI